MAGQTKRTAVVIGSGPNGLAAGALLARAGYAVTVHEAAETLGGGSRTEELTLPGFLHDVCSAIHPMAVASPCFESLRLTEYGLEWIHPPAPLAHPLDDGSAVMLERSVDVTAANLGEDGPRWRSFFGPLAAAWPQLRDDLLGPIVHIPRSPIRLARFGLNALRPAASFARSFRGTRARALFAGAAAHAIVPLEEPATAAIGMLLAALGHAVGWPMARGGSQRIADALAAVIRAHGGVLRAGSPVSTMPAADLVMCDVAPRQLLRLASWPDWYRRTLQRFRHGPGVFKIDWALDAPIPWRAPEVARAGSVHLGGTLEEIQLWERHHNGAPFVLLAQQSLFDPSRAPAGKHTAWAYCHVQNGSTEDMTAAIEDQVERFAPGFRGRILARHVLFPGDIERRNPNMVGGDIAGGANNLGQLIFRPTFSAYSTPRKGIYLCSASTPPGAAVHGMCGWNAVRAARALQ